jgi:hypothetical protein
VCNKHAKNVIETTITFKTASVCLVSLNKNGTIKERLTAISHRGIPDTINELAAGLVPDLERELSGM